MGKSPEMKIWRDVWVFFSHQGLEWGERKGQWEYSCKEGSLPRRGDPRQVVFPAGSGVLQLSANKDHSCSWNTLTGVSFGKTFLPILCKVGLSYTDTLFSFWCYILDSEFALFIRYLVELHLMCNPAIKETPLCTTLSQQPVSAGRNNRSFLNQITPTLITEFLELNLLSLIELHCACCGSSKIQCKTFPYHMGVLWHQ